MKKTAFFTMDVETYFDTSCIRAVNLPYSADCDGKDGFIDYLRLLKKYNIHATLFLTKTSIDKWGEEIKNAVQDGHELAVHALVHEPPANYSEQRFADDLHDMGRLIQADFGVKPIGYRAPCFGLNDRLLHRLNDLGFAYDSSALNYDKAIGASNIDLNEFERLGDVVYKKDEFYEIKPQTVHSMFGIIPVCGGGYSRLMPWCVIKPVLKRVIRKSDGYLFYVHPFELSKQKLPKHDKLSVLQKLFIDCGRKNYIKRIEKIIRLLIEEGYDFSSVAEYIDNHRR